MDEKETGMYLKLLYVNNNTVAWQSLYNRL